MSEMTQAIQWVEPANYYYRLPEDAIELTNVRH